ncbi:alpha/beta fold hydrolase [Streptomyces brasiliensis]|uniref:AB hydrolase-1 domain-containing protein n=1 Tax=Streptomyces brasiliensis TaxID=1954 RepID=A0A917LCF2_9ACTN|nr:alpha/beta fold hydrolase [Streptomyces brasiliensis]GGJ59968.1 hypothetical protein GCM10010121_083220 [Streptomyces brasiliensis]
MQWEAPADEEDWKDPVVLVHGGGGQSTDWMWAVDGQQGWAELFVQAGHPTYLLDRPGHGRSVWDPQVMGERSQVPDTALLAKLFQVDEDELEPGADSRFGAVGASSTGLLVEAESAQRRDAACLARLLELTGPAIVVTHSAGSPGVWLAADRSPDLVKVVVAVEPLGPPGGGERHARALSEGITAFPLGLSRAAADGRASGLGRVPVLVVTAACSGHRNADRQTANFLSGLGVAVEHVELDRHGLHGDGHGVIFDRNSTAAFHLVHGWVRDSPTAMTPSEGV